MQDKILIIIPAFNEEKSIRNVVKKVFEALPMVDIVVINDGSLDQTSKFAVLEGANVIDLPFNLGIGGAMQTGYIYAKNNGYSVAVQVDADGQHNPEYIRLLLDKLATGKYDMCIGSRFVEKTNYKSTIFRRSGMIIFTRIIHLLTGIKIADTTSGFRAVNRRVIEYFANYYPTDYPEVEVILSLYRKGFKFCEVSVEMQERQGGCSSITPFKSVYYMIKVTLALFISSIRTGEML